MRADHILAIDQGTTGSTVLIFDRAGDIRGRGYSEFPQYFPQPGWVEHDAAEIWTVTRRVIGEALASGGLAPQRISAIGIANQRETAVLWDRGTGEPVARALVWQDRRTAGTCETLRRAGHEATVRVKTGLLLDPYFSATKVRWLLDRIPGLGHRAARGEIAFGTIDSWLLWQLTGGKVHATDPSNAARTLLYNIVTKDWDADLLSLFGVPRSVLPEVRPSSGILGETTPEAFFGVRVPVAGLAGDQQAALFGQACYGEGRAKNTYGTGSFVLMNIGSKPVVQGRHLLTTVAWQIGAEPLEYALEGAVFVTGAAVQWLRDGLGVIQSAAETEHLARSVPDNGGVYFVPALTGLGAPHWDPRARGAIFGLTRGSTRAHLARAALEAMCYQTCDVVEAMSAESGVALSELRADGGAAGNAWLMQFQADILGVPVDVPVIRETTALGAAYLAGLGTGFWPDRATIDAHWRRERRFLPAMDHSVRRRLLAQWRRAVERARDWEPAGNDRGLDVAKGG